MEEKILVTVCCITYNQEEYIKDALEGFVNQNTSFKYEVIVHDDASTDNTANIIREYEKKYPDIIKPIYQKENQYSKGTAIMPILYEKSKGKYIAMCEGDDYWIDPNKLQIQVDYMEKNKECSFTFHNAEVIDMSTGETSKFVPCNGDAKDNMKKNGNYNVAELEMLYFIPTASFMFKKENALKLPKWFYKMFVGDWPLKLVMTSFGYAHFIDKKMCVYRKNAKGSITVENVKKEQQSVEQRKEILNKKNEILYNVDEFTNYKYHNVFQRRIVENEIDYLFQTNNKKEIIRKGYLKHFNLKRKIKYLIKIYCPFLNLIILKLKSVVRKIRWNFEK